MINSITLTNFKQHENLTINFGQGFTAIRGANESGKSTILLAIAYALFGTKAIPDSLDDTVRWGQPANSLRVDLQFSIDGVAYTIRRSKASCQLDYAGQTVTGQTEVTAFVARLLKVDAGAAARLTIANQSAIRGALEAGPKATTELIERLSEFDQIDNLIELMQEKLTLGNTATATAAIASAANDLERARELAVPVDADTAQALIDEAQMAHGEALARVATAEAAERAAQEAHATLREQAVRRDNLMRDVARAKSALDSALQRFEAVVVPAAPTKVDAKVTALQKQISDAEQVGRIAQVFAKVRPYTRKPSGTVYEGTIEALRTDITNEKVRVQSNNDAVITLRGDLKLLQAQLTHGSCTFCGKDFSGVPEVATRNADIVKKISETEATLAAILDTKDSTAEGLADLLAVESAHAKVVAVKAAAGEYAEYDGQGVLPMYLKWVGPEIGVVADVDGLRREIKQLQDSVVAYEKAATLRAEAVKQVEAAESSVEQAQAALADCPEVTLVQAQTELDAARDATRAARDAVEEARRGLDAHTRALADQQAAYTRAVEEIKRVSERLGTLQAQLVELEFNNALLKKVRTCRPLLADKLWTLVLAASSSYFSDIRGVKSRVTKTSDGFQIDGHPVSSMSGSTLDALGLAIRVALVRTFLPSSPFLVLDEPSSAMDGDRTGNMLGFLSRAGFQQIILCSHDPLSESVCDNLITLGA
jgi:exonuclease SbcC